jgi:hypothetical protein
MTALTTIERGNIRRRTSTASKTSRRAGNATAKFKKAINQSRKAVADAKRAVDDRISRATGIDFGWCDAALTVAGAASVVAGRHRIRRGAKKRFHDCGHWSRYKKINDHIDVVKGKNHRLKWGHSAEFLPGLVRKFGWSAVPAYAVHLAQDLTTIAGIPLIPWPRLAKIALQRFGLRSAAATACVTVNLATVVGAVGTALIVFEVGSVGYRLYVKVREKQGKPVFTVVDAISVEAV